MDNLRALDKLLQVLYYHDGIEAIVLLSQAAFFRSLVFMLQGSLSQELRSLYVQPECTVSTRQWMFHIPKLLNLPPLWKALISCVKRPAVSHVQSAHQPRTLIFLCCNWKSTSLWVFNQDLIKDGQDSQMLLNCLGLCLLPD